MDRSKLYLYSLAIVLTIIIMLTAIIFYPQLYYKNRYQIKQYKIYLNDSSNVSLKTRNELTTVLNKTDILLRKSEIFNPSLSYRIFLRTNNKPILNLPYQFNKGAYAQSIPLFHNIFVWHSNIQKDEVFIPSGHHRRLSAVLAHEMVHVLYEKHYGWTKVKLENWLDKSESSNYGFMWKEEGYAEYIAGGSGIGMKAGLKILKGQPNPSYHPIEVEYFKYWLMIKYLIENKHLTLDQIVYTKMDFNTVLQNAVNFVKA